MPMGVYLGDGIIGNFFSHYVFQLFFINQLLLLNFLWGKITSLLCKNQQEQLALAAVHQKFPGWLSAFEIQI